MCVSNQIYLSVCVLYIRGRNVLYSPKNDVFDKIMQDVAGYLDLINVVGVKDSNELKFELQNRSSIFNAGVEFNHPSVSGQP